MYGVRYLQLMNLVDDLLLKLVLGVQLVLPVLHRMRMSEDLLVRLTLQVAFPNTSVSTIAYNQLELVQRKAPFFAYLDCIQDGSCVRHGRMLSFRPWQCGIFAVSPECSELGTGHHSTHLLYPNSAYTSHIHTAHKKARFENNRMQQVYTTVLTRHIIAYISYQCTNQNLARAHVRV